jgi:hypothetical protein
MFYDWYDLAVMPVGARVYRVTCLNKLCLFTQVKSNSWTLRVQELAGSIAQEWRPGDPIISPPPPPPPVVLVDAPPTEAALSDWEEELLHQV